jgi:hypothetical protein
VPAAEIPPLLFCLLGLLILDRNASGEFLG